MVHAEVLFMWEMDGKLLIENKKRQLALRFLFGKIEKWQGLAILPSGRGLCRQITNANPGACLMEKLGVKKEINPKLFFLFLQPGICFSYERGIGISNNFFVNRYQVPAIILNT